MDDFIVRYEKNPLKLPYSDKYITQGKTALQDDITILQSIGLEERRDQICLQDLYILIQTNNFEEKKSFSLLHVQVSCYRPSHCGDYMKHSTGIVLSLFVICPLPPNKDNHSTKFT